MFVAKKKKSMKKLKTDRIQRHSKSSADFRIVHQTLKSNYDNAVFVYPIFSSCFSHVSSIVNFTRGNEANLFMKFLRNIFLEHFEKLI